VAARLLPAASPQPGGRAVLALRWVNRQSPGSYARCQGRLRGGTTISRRIPVRARSTCRAWVTPRSLRHSRVRAPQHPGHARRRPDQKHPDGNCRPGRSRPATASPCPATQRPATQRPVTQRPVTQHPVTQHPVTQHPVTQHPVTQHPAAQHPVTQRPASRLAGRRSTARLPGIRKGCPDRRWQRRGHPS
jgi:African swine fever virus J13L protein